MNRNKKSNPMHLRSKVQWWSMLIVWGFIVMIGISIVGCKKENNNDTDEYYVKYEVNSSTIYYGGKLNVLISTETSNNMNIAINTRTSWETVIGPVQKGFNASLNVTKEGSPDSHLQLNAKISVSKNGSPFALKKNDDSDTPRNSVQISYMIDY